MQPSKVCVLRFIGARVLFVGLCGVNCRWQLAGGLVYVSVYLIRSWI